MRISTIGIVAVALLIAGLIAGTAVFQGAATIQPQPATPPMQQPTPMAQSTTVTPQPAPPRYTTPVPLAPGPLSDDQLRQELITHTENLCQDLQLIAGIILNTGILNDVPPQIQQITGLTIDELEAKETAACNPPGGAAALQNLTTAELLDQARTVEWLDRVHLAAMDDVTVRNPTLRPINATGSFKAFYEIHDTLVKAMRSDLQALSANPSPDNARQLGGFWQDVLIPHARAEEQSLFPLARSVGDPNLTHSADLVEAEHKTIEDGVARYTQTLQAVEQGQAQVTDLVPIARDIRGKTELHFGKEEQSVIRVLQQKVSDQQFRPVVEDQDQAIGPWLRQQGWTGLPANP